MLTLLPKIDNALITAIKTGDKERTSIFRLIKSEITKEVKANSNNVLSDEQIINVLTKMVKTRKQSIDSYVLGNRQDLVDKEQFEINVINEYLPQSLSEDELKVIIEKYKTDNTVDDFTNKAVFGKFIGFMKANYAGRYDVQLIKNILGV